MLAHSDLAEIAGRSYSGPQSTEVALDVRVDLVPRDGELVVVFPGTHPADPLDWLRDLRALPDWIFELGLVHSGFGTGARAAWRASAFNIRRTGLITFCGHSLGGALAQLYAATFAIYRAGQPFRVVTFGAPRIALWGNRRPRELLGVGLELVEYARDGDVVPHIPLAPIYQHPSRPVVIGGSTGDFISDHSIQLYRTDLIASGR